MNKQKDFNSSTIARDTLLQLASLKLPPTPENYHKFYNQIAGNSSTGNAENQDNKSSETDINWAGTIEALLKQLENKNDTLATARKREGLGRVLGKFTSNSEQLHLKLQALMSSWTVLTSATRESTEIETEPGAPIIERNVQTSSQTSLSDHDASSVKTRLPQKHSENNFTKQILELLALILNHIAMMPLGDATLTEEAKDLANNALIIKDKHEMDQFASCFNRFCVKFESCGKQGVALRQGLLMLLNLLVNSTRESLSNDQWVISYSR